MKLTKADFRVVLERRWALIVKADECKASKRITLEQWQKAQDSWSDWLSSLTTKENNWLEDIRENG